MAEPIYSGFTNTLLYKMVLSSVLVVQNNNMQLYVTDNHDKCFNTHAV